MTDFVKRKKGGSGLVSGCQESGGSAMADGVLSVPEVIFDLQGMRYITAAPPGAWNARLFPNEDQIEVLVTGDTGETVDFIVSAKSVLT